MLLTRMKVGDRIYLDTPRGRVVLLVISTTGFQVKLGFDGPRAIPIYRSELDKAKALLNNRV